MGSVGRLLLLISCVILFHGAEGRLTKRPRNVLVLRGQDAVLTCSTDSRSRDGLNPITWKHDYNILSYEPCTSQWSGVDTSPRDSATDCNIQASASDEHGIGGVYQCEDHSALLSPTAQAVATVIVLDPVCEVILPAVNGLGATLVCKMTYEWQARAKQFWRPPNVDVSLRWTGVSGNRVRTRADLAAYSGTVATSRPMENILLSTITSHRCTVTFDFSPGSNEFVQYAVNTASYTHTCQPPSGWQCPSSVRISPSSGPFEAGDVLTCSSDGYPEPSYVWTDSEGAVVATGPTVTLTDSTFALTCTATGVIMDPCTASATAHSEDSAVFFGEDLDDNSEIITLVVVIVVVVLVIVSVVVVILLARKRAAEDGDVPG